MTASNGRFRHIALSLLTAASFMAAGGAVAQTAFTGLDKAPEASLSFSATERGTPILAGSTVNVAGQSFKPGQQVSLFYGATPISSTLTADAEGKVAGQIGIPANAVAGNHPVVVVAQGPYAASIANLKVSPTVPLSGQADFNVTIAPLVRGLYQSAYSAKHNMLYVTSAVGRPPVTQSELLKVHPDTLKIVARATPPEAPARPGAAPDAKPGVFAVYGVGVDDAKDQVWVTNTRQNTIAVYRQSDLSLVKQFDPGAVSHARDVVIDSAAGKAYAGATNSPDIQIFDTATLEPAGTISIQTQARGRGSQFAVGSLSLDPKAGRLYTVSLSTNEVAVINTKTNAVEKLFPVPGARSSIGISHDPQTGRIFVAAQGSDNLIILDGNSGAVIADTPIGAGALNVVFDPVKRLAYVSNRGAGTLAITDADGKIVANLGPAPLANHASLGKDGTIYAVDKSSGVRDAESDQILRIKPRR